MGSGSNGMSSYSWKWGKKLHPCSDIVTAQYTSKSSSRKAPLENRSPRCVWMYLPRPIVSLTPSASALAE
eukprot:9963392-Alexandrium_andersonii.AAC.1